MFIKCSEFKGVLNSRKEIIKTTNNLDKLLIKDIKKNAKLIIANQ